MTMMHYTVTVHRTVRVLAGDPEEAVFLAKLSTCYPDTLDGIVHTIMTVDPAIADVPSV